MLPLSLTAKGFRVCPVSLSAMSVAFEGLIKSCFAAFDGQRALAGHCAAGEARRGDPIRTTFYSSTFAGCPHEYSHTLIPHTTHSCSE